MWPVDSLVARALEAVGPGGEAIDVSLPEEPLAIRVDAAQLEHALVNLLENALKVSRRVSIAVAPRGGDVVFRVADDGPGISAEDREVIFEPFGRGANANGSRGTGLGLAIARGFVEVNGGRLWLEPDERPRRDVRVLASLGGRPGVNGPRVLVVDDERQILRALELKLRNAGYIVDTAATARDALAQAAMRPPEAVILDLLLPDGSGSDVARELRKWSSAPILVLSAVGEEKEKIAALDAGADDYVTKPFSGDELLARLRAALRRTTPSGEPVLEIGDLRIDRERRTVTMNGELVSLTPTEWDLLRVLAENEGKLLTHPAILRAIWGPAYREESNYLHVYVSHLRRKIEPDPARPRYLLNQPGVGYRLVSPS